jgi:hypothetical protein
MVHTGCVGGDADTAFASVRNEAADPAEETVDIAGNSAAASLPVIAYRV